MHSLLPLCNYQQNSNMNDIEIKTFEMSDGNTFDERYTIGHVLGEGGFSKVYAGMRNRDSLPVAVKLIKKVDLNLDSKVLPLEVRLMHRLSHIKGVVKLIDACYLARCLIIVMEREENSMDLSSFMEMYELTPELTRSVFRQLVETVIECHRAGVVHRDIKPDNILINTSTDTIKLIDFGCGSIFTEFQISFEGTEAYQPPELYRNGYCRSVSSTIWSLGVTLYVLTVNKFPYYDICELEKLDAEDIKFPAEVPKQCQDLVRSLLKFDHRERPSLEQILLHPYLRTQSSVSMGYSFMVAKKYFSYISSVWNPALEMLVRHGCRNRESLPLLIIAYLCL